MDYLSEHSRQLDTKMDFWANNQSEVWGIPTGLLGLDRRTGGLQNGEVTVIGGRPSMGKTALAGQIAFDVARHFQAQPGPRPLTVVFFQAEISGWQLLLREVVRKSGVPAHRIKSGYLTETDRLAIAAARGEIESLPITINDTHAISTVQVINELKRLKDTWQVNVGAVFYDHINLASDESPFGNDYKRVSQAASNLNAVAKRLNVPVVLLAQVSRQNDRADKEDTIPKLADLKDSGKIEESADVVLFVHRPDYYKKITERSHASEEPALLVLAKNRNGGDGVVPVHFYPEFTEFRAYLSEAAIETRTAGVPVL